MSKESYASGFVKAAASCGVDPTDLAKLAAVKIPMDRIIKMFGKLKDRLPERYKISSEGVYDSLSASKVLRDAASNIAKNFGDGEKAVKKYDAMERLRDHARHQNPWTRGLERLEARDSTAATNVKNILKSIKAREDMSFGKAPFNGYALEGYDALDMKKLRKMLWSDYGWSVD